MSKPEWGVKRTCQSCGARFYDLTRSPIICPKCNATVEPEVAFRSSRRNAAAVAEAKAAPARAAEAAKVAALGASIDPDVLDIGDDEDAELEAIETEEEEDDALIEDTSDLGEDDDDMAEVIDNLDEGMEDEV